MYKPIVVAFIAGLMVGCTTVGRKMDDNVGRTNKGADIVMMASRTLSVSIACPPDKVYAFVSNLLSAHLAIILKESDHA